MAGFWMYFEGYNNRVWRRDWVQDVKERETDDASRLLFRATKSMN